MSGWVLGIGSNFNNAPHGGGSPFAAVIAARS
jgi:hypothetical protein